MLFFGVCCRCLLLLVCAGLLVFVVLFSVLARSNGITRHQCMVLRKKKSKTRACYRYEKSNRVPDCNFGKQNFRSVWKKRWKWKWNSEPEERNIVDRYRIAGKRSSRRRTKKKTEVKAAQCFKGVHEINFFFRSKRFLIWKNRAGNNARSGRYFCPIAQSEQSKDKSNMFMNKLTPYLRS